MKKNLNHRQKTNRVPAEDQDLSTQVADGVPVGLDCAEESGPFDGVHVSVDTPSPGDLDAAGDLSVTGDLSAAVADTTKVALKVGLDLGTNTSVFQVSDDHTPLSIPGDMIFSVLGFPKPGIIPGIIPSDARILFGAQALEYRLHLNLKWPIQDGLIHDLKLCNLFTRHIRELIDPSGKREIWGVVGAPANIHPEGQKNLRSATAGLLDRIVIVPEPFLAAMGLRDDPGFRDQGVEGDPTKHSLLVDIGAGTTDLCLVRGYYPTAQDQVSFPRAGNFIDEMVLTGLRRRYPDLKINPVTITQLKEKHSYVGDEIRPVQVKVYVDGRPRNLDFGEILRNACESLIPDILKGIKELLSRCDSDSSECILKNIVITGGGSEIPGMCKRIQEKLRKEGYDIATTRKPADYKRLVASGALKMAENLRDDQWQIPF